MSPSKSQSKKTPYSIRALTPIRPERMQTLSRESSRSLMKKLEQLASEMSMLVDSEESKVRFTNDEDGADSQTRGTPSYKITPTIKNQLPSVQMLASIFNQKLPPKFPHHCTNEEDIAKPE
uniref:Putative wall-associated receptor kinase-like 11 n=1 Tax=Lygus hesperus TaxID=30085 RepID=A0A0A9WB16_LYGHE